MRVHQNVTKYNLRSSARKTVRKAAPKNQTKKQKVNKQLEAKPSRRSSNRPSMALKQKCSEKTAEALVTSLSTSSQLESQLGVQPQHELYENNAPGCLFNIQRYEQEKSPFDLETLLSADEIEKRHETQSLFEELISGQESCDFLY